MIRYYAGIGSRSTPVEIQSIMFNIAKNLEKARYTLRSGGAAGADSAFARGAREKDIYTAFSANEESLIHASKYHPAWDKCSEYVKALHARNSLIILGHDLKTPVDFVVCWTPNGDAGGGTGQGIRVAKAYSIPVYDLAIHGTQDLLYETVIDPLLRSPQ